MAIEIYPMTIDDYDEVIELWKTSEGMGLSDADTRRNINLFLLRNPNLSLVARDSEKLVGAVLCGHDGRRGYLHHLAVARPYRMQNIGSTLAEGCLERLRLEGIHKCHLFVYEQNYHAIAFWKKTGWVQRLDLVLMSHDIRHD